MAVCWLRGRYGDDGGFTGTAITFVPNKKFESFKSAIEFAPAKATVTNFVLRSKIPEFRRINTSLPMFTKRGKYDKLMVADDEIQRRIRTLRSFVICSTWRKCPEAAKAVSPYAG